METTQHVEEFPSSHNICKPSSKMPWREKLPSFKICFQESCWLSLGKTPAKLTPPPFAFLFFPVALDPLAIRNNPNFRGLTPSPHAHHGTFLFNVGDSFILFILGGRGMQISWWCWVCTMNCWGKPCIFPPFYIPLCDYFCLKKIFLYTVDRILSFKWPVHSKKFPFHIAGLLDLFSGYQIHSERSEILSINTIIHYAHNQEN